MDYEKIALMTGIAVYEQMEGREDIKINGYFQGDYIALNVLKSVIFGTLSYVLVLVMYVLYDMKNFMSNLYKMDMEAFIQDALYKYVVFMSVYLVISLCVSIYKYSRAKKHIESYKEALRRLYGYYSEK